MHRITHFGHFRKHHCRPGAHEQIRRIAYCRIGGHPGKSVAAAALHANHQLRSRTGFATPTVQSFQAFLGSGHNGLKHHAVAVLLLQNQNTFRRRPRRHLFRTQLFTAKSHNQRFTAKIGVSRQVLQRPDGNNRFRRTDSHAAAVIVVNGHNVFHFRIERQQFLANASYCLIDDPGGALHAGDDAQEVFRPYCAVGIAIPCKGIAHQRLLLGRHLVCQRQSGQLWRLRQQHQ